RCSVAPRCLRSFPTRRSSDLAFEFTQQGAQAVPCCQEQFANGIIRGIIQCQRLSDRVAGVQQGGEQLGAQGLGFGRVGEGRDDRSEEHTSELQSRENLVCRLL